MSGCSGVEVCAVKWAQVKRTKTEETMGREKVLSVGCETRCTMYKRRRRRSKGAA